MDTEIAITCSTDDNYAMPTAVMLYSALANLSSQVLAHVYIMSDRLSPENRDRTQRVISAISQDIKIYWCEPRLQSSDFSSHKYLSLATYNRLMIPDLLPQSVDKAIYLDSDLIILGDLSELWHENVSDWPLMAVQSFSVPTVSSQNSPFRLLYKKLQLDPHAGYFEAGVLLLNLENLRQHRYFNVALDYCRRYDKQFTNADQDGLNAVLCDNWGNLNPRWNMPVPFLRYPESWGVESELVTWVRNNLQPYEQNVSILHYYGPIKPWKAGFSNQYRKVFFNSLKQSGWFTATEYKRWYLRWLRSALPHGRNLISKRLQEFINKL